jgi:hypothetical protein
MQPSTETEALAWVDDDRSARAFLESPHQGQLRSKGKTNFYYTQPGQEDKPLRGLTDPLRECFWPQEANGKLRKAFYARDPETKARKKNSARRPVPKPGKPSSAYGSLTIPLKKARPKGKSALKTNSIKALRQGSQVHNQIDQVAKLGVNEFLDKNDSFHPFVLAVILALHVHHPELRILKTEFLAGCPVLGIATRIDIVCVDKQGRIYVVETKTGSPTEHSWKGCNGRMRDVLEPYMGNSAYNRAKVQAIAGAMMAILGTQLQLAHQVRCLVAHVNDNQVKLKLVPDATVATLGPLIYEALLAHQSRRARRGVRPVPRPAKQQKKTPAHKKSVTITLN